MSPLATDAGSGKIVVIENCRRAGHVKRLGSDVWASIRSPNVKYLAPTRVTYLEGLLANNDISFAAGQDFEELVQSPPGPSSASSFGIADKTVPGFDTLDLSREPWGQEKEHERKLDKLVANIRMVSVQGAVVFASIKTSVSAGSNKSGLRGASRPAATANRSTVRDSLWGLQPKQTAVPASFPDKAVGGRLVALYFEHANPQIPILHKGEFMALFHQAYASTGPPSSARELYMLNIVFAIGAGIILGDSRSRSSSGSSSAEPMAREAASPNLSRSPLPSEQHQPEEYHAAAMLHLDSFLESMSTVEGPDGSGGGLQELQAVLLLAGFALLRPVAPGLWYISGIATRLGVDLGLHHEDGTDLDERTNDQQRSQGTSQVSANDYISVPAHFQRQGRREWVRDLRRRLWWCVYSVDRLVSTCVGRPFGITDEVITTDFPCSLNDEDITPSGFIIPSCSFQGPSYKRVSHHYFRLRLLQSEILHVLQYEQAKQAHANLGRHDNRHMHTALSSSFLQPFESFRAWRQDVDRRLTEWKEDAPSQQDTTVQFSVQFLELNYWQAIIMLYRQSLSGPPSQAGLASRLDRSGDSMLMGLVDEADNEDVYLKVAEAGQRVLMLYRQLHRIHLVNYTYLATVHLFMAGIAFLQTLDDVDFTVLAATSVLGDLIETCPPAEACRDAFQSMSRATIKQCLSTTGFGQSSSFGAQESRRNRDYGEASNDSWLHQQQQQQQQQQQPQAQGSSRQANTQPTSGIREDVQDLMGIQGQSGNDGFRQGQTVAHVGMSSLDGRNYPPEAEDTSVAHTGSTGIHDPLLDTHDLDMLLAGDDSVIDDREFGTGIGFGGELGGVELDMFDGFFFGGTDNGSLA
ncbi:MAG: hypothetical protein Q9207_000059 [Kuettlingeria erythrocarpa]